MMLEELEGDDSAMARLQAKDEVNPLFKAAREARRNHERLMDERMGALWLAQHPFEHAPKMPSLHP